MTRIIALIAVKFVTSKAAAKHELLFRGGFIEHQSLTKVAQQTVTKIIIVTIMNLVTPKAGAKRELLYNKPASEVTLLNK